MIFENKAEVRGDHIYVNPFLFFHQEANPFAEEQRLYPIGFESEDERTFVGEITIPEGYTVVEIPAGKMFNISGNAARYLLNCEFRQGKIVITSKLRASSSSFNLKSITRFVSFTAVSWPRTQSWWYSKSPIAKMKKRPCGSLFFVI